MGNILQAGAKAPDFTAPVTPDQKLSLSDLKGRPTLSGSDFLPLVVKLDDLFNHLAQVREMLSRLVDLHQAIASRRGPMGSAG